MQLLKHAMLYLLMANGLQGCNFSAVQEQESALAIKIITSEEIQSGQLTVQLADVSKVDADAVVISNKAVAISKFPHALALSYLEADIQPEKRYSLSAQLHQQGQLVATTTTHYDPFKANSSIHQLQLEPSSSTSPSFLNTQWRLIELDGNKVDLPNQDLHGPSLQFKNKLRLTGSTGCNRLMGSYQQNGETLTIGQVSTTRMACKQVPAEQPFLKMLNNVNNYKIKGQQLQLLDINKQAVAIFEVNLNTPKKQ